MRLITLIVVLLLLNSKAVAEDIIRSISPDVGRYSGETGRTYLDIAESQDGFTAEYLISPQSTGFAPTDFTPPTLVGAWSSDSWTELTINALGIQSNEQLELALDGIFFVDFNPHNTIPGIGLPAASESMKLEPGSYSFTLIPNLDLVCEGGECSNDIEVELGFSVVPVAAPLLGDFNFDGVVNFDDFLILTRNFEVVDLVSDQALPSYRKGDVNLDGETNFADFTVMAANFGATSLPEAAFAVPEPRVPLSLGAFVALAIAHFHSTERGRAGRRRAVR